MASDNGRSVLRKLDNAIANIQQGIVKEVISLAADINATIADRVQNDGENADGGHFGTYTPYTQKVKRAKNHTSGPFPLINFTDTGLMFSNIRPTVKRNGNIVTVTISASNKAEIDKLKHNTDRFGQIIEASKDEQSDLKKDIKSRVGQLLKKYLK